MIVWGNNFYILKVFLASEFGLNQADWADVEFRIIQKYFHLYWIPFIPTGIAYTMKKRGDEAEYNAPEPIAAFMRQHQIQWWQRLGGWAWPLILVLGYTFYTVSDYVSKYQSEKAYAVELAEKEKVTADTVALRPYCEKFNKINSLLNTLGTNAEIPNMKLNINKDADALKLLIEVTSSMKDTSTLYTEDNTYIHCPDIKISSEIEDKKTYAQYYREGLMEYSFNSLRLSNGIKEWYKSNMQKEDRDFSLYELKRANEQLDQVKYVAIVSYKSLRVPTMDEENSKFETGCAVAEVSVYDIATSKLHQKFKVLGLNSDSVRTYDNNSSASNNVSLMSDLERNLFKEVKVGLRIIKSSKD
jgi:hypothetical protein